MQSRAVRKHIRNAPMKMRAVVNAVRGKNVAEAVSALGFMPHRATDPIERTLRDVVYNMIDQGERVDPDELFIKEIRVDEGQAYKRFRPAARGRAHPYKKRTSHLTVVIATADEREDADVAAA
ncbi:MAG: 50S ribosomal protein L22 [Bacteroidetes bacterium QH_9_67_14]|jgi:large subunit ribosomal protein L22|nr:MAG: 50S ribosomal protein L22 [Bacteroidetes bacterium QH_9_67_14]